MISDTTTIQLPVAVYGTLRVGYGNHRLLAGRTDEVAMATVDGYSLVVSGLPFAHPSTTGQLVVEVMWLLPHIYEEVLADLDRLEGYNPKSEDNFYNRIEVTAVTEHGTLVQAWLYEAGPRTWVGFTHHGTVPTGDYADVRQPARSAFA